MKDVSRAQNIREIVNRLSKCLGQVPQWPVEAKESNNSTILGELLNLFGVKTAVNPIAAEEMHESGISPGTFIFYLVWMDFACLKK